MVQCPKCAYGIKSDLKWYLHLIKGFFLNLASHVEPLQYSFFAKGHF